MSKYLRLDDAGKQKEEAQGVAATTGAGDADKLVATDANGKIDPSFMYDAEVILRTAYEDLDARDLVNVFDDAGTAKARKADASAFATRATGIVLNNHLTGEQARVISEGIIGGFSGLTINDPVFLSAATPGDYTQTPPTGSGEIWQKIGEAVSATEIRLEIGEAIERV